MKRSQQQKRAETAKTSSRRHFVMIGLVIVGVLLIVTAVLLPKGDGEINTGDLSNRQFIAMGEEVYGTYCAACHGFDLEGQPEWQQPFEDGSFKAPPHDETGHTWHHSDAYLVDSIKQGGARLEASIGVSSMPAYSEILTDQQISAVLAYIKSEWPPEILEAQSGR